MIFRQPRPPAPARSVVEPGLPAPRLPRSGLLRQGYAVDQVDVFLLRLRRAAEERPPAMTVAEVAAEQFQVTRLGRGYEQRAVDDYLDEAVDRLRLLGAAEGEPVRERRGHTGWIYVIGATLVVLIVCFALIAMML